MKTETTREDLIKIRGEIDQVLTGLEFEKEINVRRLFIIGFRAIYAILNFVIRKTWGV